MLDSTSAGIFNSAWRFDPGMKNDGGDVTVRVTPCDVSFRPSPSWAEVEEEYGGGESGCFSSLNMSPDDICGQTRLIAVYACWSWRG